MGSSRGYNHQQESDPFLYDDNSGLSTAYHGAGCNLELSPAARLDSNGFEDIRLSDRSRSSQPTRERLGSRLLSSPTAAALSRSGSVLHSRAKSWAVNVSKLNTSNTSTPEKPQTAQRNKFLSGLFDGESTRVQLGVPTSPEKEKEETEFVMEYRPVLTERPPSSHIRRASTLAETTPTKNQGTRKASWFARKPSMPPAPVVKIEDEMLTLNINNGLFPHGPADPLSPHAFNDLLLNASNLLLRMQAAYKEKVEYIASIQPEIDAQKEEVEEAKTRSEHLKMQLADIGRQNQEQLQVNEELLAQLSQERLKFHEALESTKTIRLVRSNASSHDSSSSPHRNRKRDSNGTASDSGFESDAETSSLFSSGMQISNSQREQGYMNAEASITRCSRFQEDIRCDETMRIGGGEGARASAREWSTVEKLREENFELKVQMEEMRRGLEGCIEFVEGVGGLRRI